MAVRKLAKYDEQSGVTTVSDDFIIDNTGDVHVAVRLTSGTPVTGARVQFTLDEKERISAGTANWINSPLGVRTVTGSEKVMAPVTGIRVSVTDGTWAIQLRQA